MRRHFTDPSVLTPGVIALALQLPATPPVERQVDHSWHFFIVFFPIRDVTPASGRLLMPSHCGGSMSGSPRAKSHFLRYALAAATPLYPYGSAPRIDAEPTTQAPVTYLFRRAREEAHPLTPHEEVRIRLKPTTPEPGPAAFDERVDFPVLHQVAGPPQRFSDGRTAPAPPNAHIAWRATPRMQGDPARGLRRNHHRGD